MKCLKFLLYFIMERGCNSEKPNPRNSTLDVFCFIFFSEKGPPHVLLSLFALGNDAIVSGKTHHVGHYSTLAFPFPLFTSWARHNPFILNPTFWLILAMEEDKYAKELEVAVRVVHVACALCGRVQERLLETSNDHVLSKDDDSPVTVAGICV